MRYPGIRGLVVYTGVWLRAEETEISATLWVLWLGKNFILR